jgi:peroxiredoxin
VRKADPVPPLQLKDLDGQTLDLSTLRGRHTLLLFWNPDCSFCRGMLADLKTQERTRPANAPDVLVISSGSAEANRAQGLSSRVLLDPHFAAGTIFGAEGTPSSVLIDEEGRVASDIGVGARGAFKLVGFLP